MGACWRSVQFTGLCTAGTSSSGRSSSWSLQGAQTGHLRAPQPHAVSPRLALAGGLRVDSTSSAHFPGGARPRHRHPAAEKSRSSLRAARKLP